MEYESSVHISTQAYTLAYPASMVNDCCIKAHASVPILDRWQQAQKACVAPLQ